MAKLARKRPITVEYVQWTGDNDAEVLEFVGQEGFHRRHRFSPDGRLWVKANTAWLDLPSGDFIIHDAAGFYPCKADIFAATYEPVV